MAESEIPAVSVLMPVYNAEAKVARAIESILRQTFRDFELIVFDDGSTDGTTALVSHMAASDARIRLLQSEHNGGLPSAVNEAFLQSAGALVARMDADDVALADRLEKQVEFMRRHSDVDVLGTAAYEVDDGGRYVGISRRRETHEEIAACIYRENPFIHPTVMFRREFFDAIGGYDKTLRRGQDHDLWLRGYRRFRYHNLVEPLIEYTAPQRPTWRNYRAAVYVVCRAGFRDRRPVSGLFFSGRILVAYVWSRISAAIGMVAERRLR